MPIETLLLQPVTGDPDITYTARQLRAHLVGNLISREGVRDKDGGDLKVVQRGSGPNMSVDVSIGRAGVFGDDASDQGPYSINSSTVINRTVPAASASQTRTHRVILQVRDKLENSSWSQYDSDFIVQADTAAAASMPASAIPLASIAVPANSTSVTNAMITDLRPRGSVGTPWLVGNMLESGIHSSYGGRDATRPLTWTKNPDGWTFLSGFIRRTGANTNISGGQIYGFDGGTNTLPMLPADARPAGIRDVTMMTDNGPCNLAVYANGAMSFRFKGNETLVANQTWFSFDGVVFRATPFS